MSRFSTRKKKILSFAIILLLVAVGVFGMGRIFGVRVARAGAFDTFGDIVNRIVGGFVSLLVWIGGKVLAVLMWFLFKVAKYNNFIGSPAVKNGWFIARDICNIFFVVIFLAMTVATVLGIESYHYSRILTKLLIMVVLINFSKLICGIFIDAAQVIMLTFMNSFGELGSGYLTNILGITDLLAATKDGSSTAPTFFSMAGSYILVLVYVIVAIATILVMSLVLVQRIIMLWIYVILSPFAYMLSAFPAGASYSSKWWDEFVKYVTIGPIIAFFIWLSFVSMGNLTNQGETLKDMDSASYKRDSSVDITVEYKEKEANLPQAGDTIAGSPSHLVKFIFGIAMLLGGLMVAQTIGGMAGSFAGSTIKNLQEGGVGAMKTGADWLNRKVAGGWTGKGWNIEQMKAEGKGGLRQFGARVGNIFARGTGQDLHLGRRWAKIKAGMEGNKADDISQMEQRADQLMRGRFGALTGTGSADYYNQYVQGYFGLKGAWKGAKNIFIPPEKYDEKARGAKKEIDKLEKQKNNVLTMDEMKAKELSISAKGVDLERDFKNYENNINPSLTALNSTIDNLTKAIENPKLRGGKTMDELEKDLANKEKERDKIMAGLSKRKKLLASHKEESDQYYKDKSDGIIIIENDNKSKKSRIDNLDGEIKRQQKIKKEQSEEFAKYMVMSPDARQARRAEQNKAEHDLATDDNEELVDIYRNSLNEGKRNLAAAIMKKLAKNKDTNEILRAFGYNVALGLTRDELKKLTPEEIKGNKGLHDFLRDTLIDQAGMDEQDVFALESELAEIHKATNQAAYSHAVTIKGGKFIQNTKREQSEGATADLSKQDPETLARKETRFAFGGEGVDGKFRMHTAGLNWFMGNYGAFEKQIESNRLSRWTGLKFTEAENMKILREGATLLGETQRAGYEKFLDKFEDYGRKLRGGMGDFTEALKKTGEAIDRSRSY
ncbi:MAG: hypothetical protein V1891_00785 [bacterium]